MKLLFLLIPMLGFVIEASAQEQVSDQNAGELSTRLAEARLWIHQIEVLKTIARERQNAAFAIPALENYLTENRDRKCGLRMSRNFALMTLYAVKDGDNGLNRYLVMAQNSGGTSKARQFAEKLLDEKGFVSLFDGKSFKGWEGKKGVFRIEDSAIVAGNLKEKIPNNEFLCTKKTYSNFELRLQARLIGEGKNAGIQFRSKRIPNHHEVIGFQADIGVTGKDHSIWGALYDESRRRKFLAEGDQEKLRKAVSTKWNDFVIRCEGPRIQIWVNKVQTVDYTEKDPEIATSGIIGLQIHSGPPAEAWYRNIRIRELNAPASK